MKWRRIFIRWSRVKDFQLLLIGSPKRESERGSVYDGGRTPRKAARRGVCRYPLVAMTHTIYRSLMGGKSRWEGKFLFQIPTPPSPIQNAGPPSRPVGEGDRILLLRMKEIFRRTGVSPAERQLSALLIVVLAVCAQKSKNGGEERKRRSTSAIIRGKSSQRAQLRSFSPLLLLLSLLWRACARKMG